MQDNEITMIIKDWVSNARDPQTALLPQNLNQQLIDIFTSDTKDMASEAKVKRPEAGHHITMATLLLKMQIEKSNKLDITETELRKTISRYAHAVNLEGLERKGVVKDIKPSFSKENIFDENVEWSFVLTKLGESLVSEANLRDTLPDMQPEN